jgi:hypothetical protein
MRTTLTIEPQIAAKLKEFLKKNDLSLKSAVNELLKRGLSSENKASLPKKYSTKPHDANKILVEGTQNIGALLSMLDEEN